MNPEKQKFATNLQKGYQKFGGKDLTKVVHIEVTLIRITQTQVHTNIYIFHTYRIALQENKYHII